MSLSREQMREQMIGYLYGELEGEALQQFEAALSESEQSQRELAELQATLRVARVELSRDAQAQPPTRVRDAVIKAAHAQLAATATARAEQHHGAAAHAQLSGAASHSQPMAADARPPTRDERTFLRWLRSVWILPSLVAATAAALLVFKQDQGALAPVSPPSGSKQVETSPPETAATSEARPEARGPADDEPALAPVSPEPSGSKEGSPTRPPRSAAEPTAASEAKTSRGAADDSSSAPPAKAPARSARKADVARETSREEFAAPPAEWQRRRSTDTQPSAPALAPPSDMQRGRAADTQPSAAALAPPSDMQRGRAVDTQPSAPAPASARATSRDGRAPAAELQAPEGRDSAALQTTRADDKSSSLGSARQRSAAPSAAAPSTPSKPTTELPSKAATAPAPLTAARLERRARAHVAAKRWPQAAADYRELLRRFQQDPRRDHWLEELNRAQQATPKD